MIWPLLLLPLLNDIRYPPARVPKLGEQKVKKKSIYLFQQISSSLMLIWGRKKHASTPGSLVKSTPLSSSCQGNKNWENGINWVYLKRRTRATSRNSCCTWVKISQISREFEFPKLILQEYLTSSYCLVFYWENKLHDFLFCTKITCHFKIWNAFCFRVLK